MSGLRFLTAGESHGEGLVAIVEGMPSGVPLQEADVDRDLKRRQVGYGRGGRMAIEADRGHLLSGVSRGLTIGSPIAVLIANRDWANWRDRPWPALSVPRPGHADLAGTLKYELDDCRPVLERASARETAARVAAGAVARRLLRECGVEVGCFVERIGGAAIPPVDSPPWEWTEQAEVSDVRCPDRELAEAMRHEIDAARAAGDSLGGVVVVLARGLPPGLGSHVHWDRRLDGRLAQALMSVPALKGVEVGPAFVNAARSGTTVHDAFAGENGRRSMRLKDAGRIRPSDRSGGLEGGMTTGQLLVLRAAMKPIPTTVASQSSFDLKTGAAAVTEYQRSDVCAVPAAAIVAESMACLVLADALLDKFGGDALPALQEALRRYANLPLLRGAGGRP